jgi:hypothetical protein
MTMRIQTTKSSRLLNQLAEKRNLPRAAIAMESQKKTKNAAKGKCPPPRGVALR